MRLFIRPRPQRTRATLAHFAALAACSLLWSCSAVPPAAPRVPAAVASAPAAPDLGALYGALRSSPGRVLRLQSEASRIRIYVFRAGRSPALGHNHVLSAPQFEGYAYLPENGLEQARLDLVLRLDQLVFDLPAHRAEAGPAFASALSEAAVEATRAHMLGADNMQAERFPLVRIAAMGLSGELPRLSARVLVEMHGQTRAMLVPVTASGLPRQLKVSGALVLRQSEFGVQPYSVMSGLLAVQDELRLEFELVGE